MTIQSQDITSPQDSEPLEQFLSATQAHAQDRHIRVRLGSAQWYWDVLGQYPTVFHQKKTRLVYSCLVPGSFG